MDYLYTALIAILPAPVVCMRLAHRKLAGVDDLPRLEAYCATTLACHVQRDLRITFLRVPSCALSGTL